MTYGVKMIHTYTVDKEKRHFYEELILRVNADSFDEAYEKAEYYMRNHVYEYTNSNDQSVKTLSVEAIDCFLCCNTEDDVQEVYSSFSTNRTSLPEQEYYRMITYICSEQELRSLRNKDFN